MQRRSIVKFADLKTKEAFKKLKESKGKNRRLYNSLRKAIRTLSQNVFSGTQIPKKLIPREYIHEYGIDNLWKYNLPGGWRLLYSVTSDGIVIITIILEWMNHKEYEKKNEI